MDLNNDSVGKLLKIFTIAAMGGVLNAVWQISRGQRPSHALVSVVVAVLTGTLTGIGVDEIGGLPEFIKFAAVSISSVFAYQYLELMGYLVGRVDRRVRRVADEYIDRKIKGEGDDK